MAKEAELEVEKTKNETKKKNDAAEAVEAEAAKRKELVDSLNKKLALPTGGVLGFADFNTIIRLNRAHYINSLMENGTMYKIESGDNSDND